MFYIGSLLINPEGIELKGDVDDDLPVCGRN
jgi:hypothetical protein